MNFVGLALFFALADANQLREEFFHDFRGSELDSPFFAMIGPDAAERITSEAGGARITLPAQQKLPSPVGLSTTFVVKGDFEITISYEILLAKRPKVGQGVGLEFYLMTDTATEETVRFARVARVKEGDVYMCSRLWTKEGTRERQHQYFATTAKSGRLRLTRTGTEATFWASEGESDDFRALYRCELGAEDVPRVYVAAYPGRAQNAVDLLIKDFRIRAESLTNLPTPASPGTWWKGLLLWAFIISLPLGLLLYARRPTPSPPAPLPGYRERGAVLLIVAIYACAIYANLSFALTDPANYRFFPPFEPGVNANSNGQQKGEYCNIARSLAAGSGFANPFSQPTGATAWTPPVLPGILAGLLWLSDGSRAVLALLLIVIQAHVLIATGLLILALVRQTTTRLGTAAALVIFFAYLAVDFRSWFQSSNESWLALLAIDLLIAGLYWSRPLQRMPSATGWGIFGGLSGLINPVIMLAWAVLSVLVALQRRTWLGMGLAVLFAVLTLAPWTVRNYLVFERIIPVRSNLAFELYQSQCLQADGLLGSPSGVWFRDAERQQFKALGEMSYLDEKWEQFRKAVCAQPADFLDKVARRMLAATLVYEPLHPDEEARRPWSLWAHRIGHALPFLSLLLLCCTTLWQRRPRVQWLVIGVYVLYLLPYIVISYYDRYALPLLGVKVLLVIWAADQLLTWRAHAMAFSNSGLLYWK